jgi:hypothetical protein
MPNPIIEKVQANPTKVFDNPAEVLQAPINTEEKLKVLKSWENEAHQLQAATEENMTGGEPSRLDEIRKAIDRIEKEMVVP